jgi:hypothetical protein
MESVTYRFGKRRGSSNPSSSARHLLILKSLLGRLSAVRIPHQPSALSRKTQKDPRGIVGPLIRFLYDAVNRGNRKRMLAIWNFKVSLSAVFEVNRAP